MLTSGTFDSRWAEQNKSRANLAILIVDILIEATNDSSVNEERTHHNNGL